uniref:Putative nuclear speckle splicing regulatory protein 1 n=1 Tax=Amblyomma cajennense TaxID=34607 RepID=A0A023FMB6_AMBCJ
MAAPKKYGLILPKKSNKPALSSSCVFGEDSDDEHDKANIERSMRKESMRNLKKIQTQLVLQKAMAEDPSVFEYDEVYDDLKKTKEDKKQEVSKDRKPRYIEQLLKSAENRKRESDRRMQRKIQKERETEGETFEDKEAYVTSAYKRKMLELQEEEEREMRRDQIDQMMDVTRQKDLSGFYRHLLKQEVGEERIPLNTDKPMDVPEDKEPQPSSSSFKEPAKSQHRSQETCTGSSPASSDQHDRDSTDSDHSVPQSSAKNSGRKNASRQDRKSYRTRKASEPSEDEATRVAEPSTSENVDRDLDADSDFEVESEDSSSEEESRQARKEERKVSKGTKEKDGSKPVKEEEMETSDTDEKHPAEQPPARAIQKDWKLLFQKRTVGEKLEAAITRYFERKAEMDAYRSAHGSVQ